MFFLASDSSRFSPNALQTDIRKRTAFTLDRLFQGALRRSDTFQRSLRSYFDSYHLPINQAGQPIELTLRSRSKSLVPRLQVINASTRKPIANVQTSASRQEMRLVFTPEAPGRYTVRVTSRRPRQTGRYTLQGQRVPLNPGLPATPGNPSDLQPALPAAFNFLSGYGLVDASAAVAQAIGQTPFADVPFQDVAIDASSSYFWGIDRVKAPEVWARGYTGQNVTVAIIDTGVAYAHPALRDNIWVNADEIPGNKIDDDRNGFVDDVNGWDFAARDNDPGESFAVPGGHGTLVAGVIAGKVPANVANAAIAGRPFGVAPNARIMPIRALSGLSLFGNADQIAAGIQYAVQNGADVINLSLGFGDGNRADAPNPTIESALQLARQAGVVVVMAAGNERSQPGTVRPSEPAYAASRDLGIAVGAIDRSGRVAEFSNPVGNQPLDFVVAPGSNIFVPSFDGLGFGASRYSYAIASGTSFAAPAVSGIAALMLSANPALPPAQIETILVQSANPRGVIPVQS